MKKIVKDISSIKDAGKKAGEAVKEVCLICGAEACVIDGKSFCMCDCDKIRPVELGNV